MKIRHFLLTFAALLAVFPAFSAEKKVVFYRDFGAKGDGKTNDLPAIAKAHEYANEPTIDPTKLPIIYPNTGISINVWLIAPPTNEQDDTNISLISSDACL